MTQVPEILDHAQEPTAVVHGSVPLWELRDFYDASFTTVAAVVERQGVTPSSAIGLYLSPPGERFELEVGFVVDRPIQAHGDVVPSALPGGQAARLTHVGAYDDLAGSWGRLMTWIDEQGLTMAGPMWEVYVTEPTPETDPATLRTDLFVVVNDARN